MIESSNAIKALEALAQEHRLAIFRTLVEAGRGGSTPGALSEELGLAGPTLSFHLAQLRNAGLVSVRRNGRSLIYGAAYETMNALIGFLSENCCVREACPPKSTTTEKEKRHETPARARQRA
jgi:DNA-binding transcriptional ArsR family regulator